ncbi:MAG: ABC transporter permease [Gemmatimonadaceae bacterium]|nr:ABC transporter permease [Gemmatimonadaceae bacterium]
MANRSPLVRDALRRAPWAMAWLGTLAVAAVLAPVLAPFDPVAQPDIIADAARPPSAVHWMGTDLLSRDVFSRVVYGARVSLGIGLAGGGLAALLGAAVGLLAGSSARWVDAVLMRIVDVGLSVPRVVVLLAISAAWGALSPLGLVAVLVATGWFGVAKLVRADTRALRTEDWIVAARALGVPPSRVLWRHLWPAVLPNVLIAATLGVGHTIAIEAALSFLGLGIQPPTPSWGTMLADAAERPLETWWLLAAPGLALASTALACSAAADALRTPREAGEVAVA